MMTQTIKSTGSKADDSTSQFTLRARRSKVVKRAFDIVLSGLGLFCLSPVFGLLALLIKRNSRGPVFSPGMRLGRGDKPFSILKFRTMREEAASYAGSPLTAEDDPHITPLGKWLPMAYRVGAAHSAGGQTQQRNTCSQVTAHCSLTTDHCFLPPIPIR